MLHWRNNSQLFNNKLRPTMNTPNSWNRTRRQLGYSWNEILCLHRSTVHFGEDWLAWTRLRKSIFIVQQGICSLDYSWELFRLAMPTPSRTNGVTSCLHLWTWDQRLQ